MNIEKIAKKARKSARKHYGKDTKSQFVGHAKIIYEAAYIALRSFDDRIKAADVAAWMLSFGIHTFPKYSNYVALRNEGKEMTTTERQVNARVCMIPEEVMKNPLFEMEVMGAILNLATKSRNQKYDKKVGKVISKMYYKHEPITTEDKETERKNLESVKYATTLADLL